MKYAVVFVAALLAVPAAAQLVVSKRADLAGPAVLGPGQGAIVVGYKRPDGMSAGKSAVFSFGRYDVDTRDLVLQPRKAKKDGDTRTYTVLVRSVDRKLAYELEVMLVSAGDYVATGGMPGPAAQITNTFCLGAPTFRVEAGEVVYFGDLTPYLGVRMKSGVVGGSDYVSGFAMAYSADFDTAKAALASQPALAAALKPAQLRNGATYACYGQSMTAYEVPGAPPLPPVTSKLAASQPPVAPPAP